MSGPGLIGALATAAVLAFSAQPAAAADAAKYQITTVSTATWNSKALGTKEVDHAGNGLMLLYDGKSFGVLDAMGRKVLATAGNGKQVCVKTVLDICHVFKITGSGLTITMTRRDKHKTTDITTMTIAVEGRKCKVTSYKREYATRTAGKVTATWSNVKMVSQYCRVT